MTGERWQEVKAVLESALQLDSAKRSAYLEVACSSDPSLRREVESLLAADHQSPGSFLKSPVLEKKLEPGTQLGDYEIQSLLGTGGMGEVYRARDLRLRRGVAIKVLPAMLSTDPERLRRFEQEATAAAALSHTNILAVYRLGTYAGAPYLVSELLEGETLREQLRSGRIAFRRAVDYAIQISRGLAAAHEKGIVHRDLKPENLFITKDGQVKILDFGLAKLTQPQPGAENSAPTIGSGQTEAGTVMGTVGYMSPEQVRGQPADHRADIFALGVILYEMLTGKRAFQKPTSPETMTAILNEDPPEISQLVPHTPPALQRLVQRCLEKNPEQRFQSTTDLTFALEALSDSGVASSHSVAEESRSRWNWMSISTVALAVVALVVALGFASYYSLHRSTALTSKDVIVLADFDNKTGNAVFEDTLKTGLGFALTQSPFLNVLSDDQVAATLKLMMRPATNRLTPEAARELCIRTGSKAYVAGSIANLGDEYVLGLKAVDCRSGETLAQEQVTAGAKEKVLNALGEAATKLRGKLGESLATAKKYDVPLQQATTPSLEALKSFSLGRQINGDYASAVRLFQQAIRLDPNFAVAYAWLGSSYYGLGEETLAAQNVRKAFDLREHTSERERFSIEASYYIYVTGNLEKARQTCELWAQTYPSDNATSGYLTFIYSILGENESALAQARKYVRENPTSAQGYANLLDSYVFLNRLDEAAAVSKEAHSKMLDSFYLRFHTYQVFFVNGDMAGMAQQVSWATGKREAEAGFLDAEASSNAFYGHLKKAVELERQAIVAAQQAELAELATSGDASEALREALFGNQAEARRSAAAALKMSKGHDVQATVAWALAIAGDTTHAQTLADDLSARYPEDTVVQFVYLPLIRAQIELTRKNSPKSVELLRAAEPYEFGQNSILHPAYVRGQAYLADRRGSEAIVEFQKILDHSGVVVNDPIGALAHLQIARAYVGQAESTKAKAAYQDFLTLWKNADPDIPILQQAKAEYARLQ